uniref:BPTI/Kunitz inhibitor domain-containing protein n=1 Tax=Bos mutus grunniens TaxID=30521 RepID=A0A8B9XTL6_BOSMU
MNQLCLSAALLFLLVILVDSTPVYEHHTQDQGRSRLTSPLQMMISGRQLENHAVEVFPTQMLREENKADSKPAFCLEPKVTGHSKSSWPRYFYNAETGHCEQFTYGGLGGNKNNFITEEECMKTCGQGAGSLREHAKSGPQKP